MPSFEHATLREASAKHARQPIKPKREVWRRLRWLCALPLCWACSESTTKAPQMVLQRSHRSIPFPFQGPQPGSICLLQAGRHANAGRRSSGGPWRSCRSCCRQRRSPLCDVHPRRTATSCLGPATAARGSSEAARAMTPRVTFVRTERCQRHVGSAATQSANVPSWPLVAPIAFAASTRPAAAPPKRWQHLLGTRPGGGWGPWVARHRPKR